MDESLTAVAASAASPGPEPSHSTVPQPLAAAGRQPPGPVTAVRLPTSTRVHALYGVAAPSPVTSALRLVLASSPARSPQSS
ncbi:hypothetical protein EJ04DRAFT_512062 [Polyplosphaeria fusca]|uniref:Uncharacterized protein n=1 Tax=Polyplosphaeria fusca TaxID=682080 RepID=A0A9P4QZ13_9PLEO|nr:hypothetical protein EJ04DRAFT_512062 [Polyplosphaeria fusca]